MSHKRIFDFMHARGCKVLMHSCGFIEPFLPYIVEAGLDCLQAMEVKAGMDPIRIHKNYGDKIALFGGMDVRVLSSNDKSQIDKELEKLPVLMQNYGYILHSDHSIPDTVEYETYRYFLDKALQLGTYK